MFASALLLSILIFCIAVQGGEDASTAVLKIGTPNVVKSASILGDSNMGVFTHLSNPTLTKMAANGSIVGLTAKSYEVSEDGKTWKFYINDDLYWSDGEKLTPEDVKFTFDYLAENYPAAGWIKNTVDRITAEDGAVVFYLNKPYSRLNLEFATYPILSKHIWETIDKPMEYTNDEEIVGFGPFFIAKTDLSSGVIYFKKNPYWKGAAPKFGSLEIHTFTNADVLALALEKGEVDAYYKYAGTYPYESVKNLKDTGNFDFVETNNIGLVFLAMNLQKEPMSDTRFREAVSNAINYDEILDIDALGYGQVPNAGFVPPSMNDFKETPMLKYNVDEAKSILEKAGYKDANGNGILEDREGKDIKLTFLTRSAYQRTTELMAEYLKAVGIDSELKTVDSSTWIKQKDAGEYDLTVTRSTPWGMLMHASWGTGYFDSRRTGEGVFHVLNDTVFLNLCDDILNAANEDQLQDYAYQLQDYYAENLPAIALYWNLVETPYNRAWQGWYSDPLYGIFNVDNFLSVEKGQ